LILHPAAQAGVLSAIFFLIVTIEAMLQISRKTQGLFEDPISLVGRYSWLYLFPVVFFIIGLTLEVFDSAVRSVQLLTAFSYTPQPADRFITYTPLAHTAVTLLWHALSHAQVVGLASTASTFILAVIKILVAGLFVPHSLVVTRNEGLSLNSTFNGTFKLKNMQYVDNPFQQLSSQVSFCYVWNQPNT
jgi:hypothetical protein